MAFLTSIRLPAKLDSLGKIMETITGSAGQHGADINKTSHIELALEEALVNVFSYAYPAGTGEVEVRCSLKEKNKFIMEIIDSGPPFNPLSEDEPDLTANIDERKIGGLGIFFIKQLMDHIEYTRENDCNILTITKYL